MKKIILLTFLSLAFVTTQAQVGIDTDTPTETLNVNGTMRVNDLPLDGAENAINTLPDGSVSASKDQTFTATKTLVADENGVIGVMEGSPNTLEFASTYKEVTTAEINADTDNAGDDGITIHNECLILQLNPNAPLLTYYVDLRLKLLPTCAPGSETVYSAITVYGGDSGDSSFEDSSRFSINKVDFTEDDFSDRTMSATPLMSGKIALVDLGQIYEYTYFTNWNPVREVYQMGLYLARVL